MKDFLKGLYFLIIFSILHFAYDLFPNPVFKIISGLDESVFQHLKIGFYSYLFVNIIEFFIKRKKIKNLSQYIYPRLFTVVLIPWIIFVIWYTAPAFYGKIESTLIEVVFSCIVVLVSGIIGSIIEKDIERVSLSNKFKTVILILFIITLSLNIIFNYKLPWLDMFVNPEMLISS